MGSGSSELNNLKTGLARDSRDACAFSFRFRHAAGNGYNWPNDADEGAGTRLNAPGAAGPESGRAGAAGNGFRLLYKSRTSASD